MDELANSYLNGRDEYPKTIVAAYNLVLHWAGGNKTAPTGQNDAVSFNTIDEEADVNTTSGGVILRKDGLPVKCVICGDNHWPNKCPNKQRRRFTRNNDPISETAATPTTTHNTSNSSGSGAAANVTTDNSTLSTPTNEVANVTISDQPDFSGDWNQYYSGVSFFTMTHNVHADLLKNITDAIDYDHILEQSDGKINPNWTLLDNQSTVDVFSNPAFLMQIHQVSKGLRIFSTGGSTTTDWIGLLPNYGWVWFHPKGIANILSLAKVKNKFRVTYDSSVDNLFHVHLSDTRKRSFKESSKGLYYSDMREHQQATVLVNTIEYNKSKYSSSDYSRAVDARKVQNIIGAPTFKQYRHIVDSNTMRNCPLLPTDIEAAEDIFGKNIQILKGRTTNKKSMHLRSYVTKIPITILEKYKLVTITGDIMFVNKLRFVITKSRAIKFTTSQFINSAKETDLFESILATKKYIDVAVLTLTSF